MIRLNLRLNRSFILWWLLGLSAFLAVTPPAYLSYYPELADRGSLAAEMGSNLGTKAVYGVFHMPGTIGQFTTWETGAWMAILAAVMSALLITRLHRAAESSGSSELVQSVGLPRSHIIRGAYVTGVIVALIVGVVSTGILLALRFLSTDEISVTGSFSFGAMLALTMVGTMAVTSILQALWGRPTTNTRLGLLGVAVAFLVRMFADTDTGAWTHNLNWVSPLGWRALINPFTDDDWQAVTVLTVVCLALLGVGLALDSGREFNSGLVHLPERRRIRPRSIRGLLSLNLITHRGSILAWSITTGVVLATMLPLVDSLIPLVDGDEATAAILRDIIPVGDLQVEFILYLFQMTAILVACAAVMPLITYVSQEKERLIDAVRATGLRRWQPLWGAVATGLVSIFACMVLSIIGAWIGLMLQDSTVEDGLSTIILAGLSFFPQTLVFLGIATLIAGWAPRLIQFSWLPIVAAAVVSLLGAILGLTPEQVDLSPLSHTMSLTDSHAVPLTVFATLGLAGIILGVYGAQRRDIH